MKLFRNNKSMIFGALLISLLILSNVISTHADSETLIRSISGDVLASYDSGVVAGIAYDELTPRGTARSGSYNGEDGSSISWTLSSAGALTVNGTGCLPRIWYDNNLNFIGSEIKSVTINSGITSIDDVAFYECSNLTSVTLPGTLSAIGIGAFANCSSLTSITIPDTVTNLGDAAFANCGLLTSVELSDTLQIIGEAAFENCIGLSSISLPNSLNSLGRNSFFNCPGLTEITIPSSITKIEDALFAYCSSLSTVNLPDDITSIGGGAFGYCSALSEIIIPNSCKSIGLQAFYSCTTITNITIPSGTTTIRSGTFYQCSSLQNIEIPDSVRSIGDHAFTGCSNLTYADLGNGITTLGSYSFGLCERLNNIQLPDSLVAIGEGTFAGCSSLVEISIPDNVSIIPRGMLYQCTALQNVTLNSHITRINDFAFMNCSNLNNIYLPGSINYLGDAVFSGCSNFKSVTLPSSLTTISDGLFMNCDSLQTVTSNGNITIIGKYAFSDCKELTTLIGFSNVTSIDDYAFFNNQNLQYYFPATIETLGEGAFCNCDSLTSVSIGANLRSIGDRAFAGCTGLGEISVASTNAYFFTDGHLLYTKDMTNLITSVTNGSLYDVVIPDTVQNISKYAFYGRTDIRSVVLPSTLTRIEDHMFFGCTELREVTIPQSVSSVGEYAFANCTSLVTINIPAGVSQIGEGAFMGCSSLRSVDLSQNFLAVLPSYIFAGCTSLDDFDFPDSVTLIGEYAFALCVFQGELVIPDSVSEISDFAFKDSSGIVSVIFPETVTSLGRCAFNGSRDLSNVHFKGDVYAIGAGAFEDTPLENVYFAGNAPEVIGENAFLNTSSELLFHYNEAGERWSTPTWEGPDNITYHTSTVITGTCGDSAKWQLVTHSGILTISGSGAMYDVQTPDETPWYEYNSMIKSVIIEEGITRIGSKTFSGIDSLTEVSIPSSVTDAGYAAFADSQNISVVNTNGGLRAVGKCMFYRCDQILSIEFAEGLSSIGDYAFYGCANLEEVVIPASVQTIGEGAFSTCLSMETVKFLGTVSNIGQGAFFNCAALTNIYIMQGSPTTTGNYAFADCNENLKVYGTTSVSWLKDYSGTTETEASSVFSGNAGGVSWSVNPSTKILTISGNGAIPDYSSDDAPWYQYNSQIHSVNILQGVTEIGDYAFSEMANINYVTIPDSVTSIGKYAFGACSSLREINLPDSITLIDVGAFSACVSLQEVVLPGGVTRIYDHVFSECLQLKTVSSRSMITQIGYGSFYCCTSLENIPFISGVQSIGDFAFTMNTSLVNIDLSSCSTIGIDAFFSCAKLQEVIFSNNLTYIGKKTFSQSGLINLVIPQSLVTIAESAFELCESLRSVSFAGENHIIETDAFYGCTNLANLNLSGVSEIGSRAFMACGMSSVHISRSVNEIGDGAFADCESLVSISNDSSQFIAKNDVLYKGSQLIQFPAGINIGGFTLPEFVTSIASDAFYGCERLVEVGIGDQVTSIGDAAFALCSGLRRVIIGSGIETIPTALFGECFNLELVRYTGDSPSSIEEDAFYNCPDTMIFEFFPDKSGWSEGSWIGPDGRTYLTRTVFISVEVINSLFEPNGQIQANLRVTNTGPVSVNIKSIQINDDRFVVSGQFPFNLSGGGGIDQSVSVSTNESVIGNPLIFTATVEVDGYIINLPVRFSHQELFYLWTQIQNDRVKAQIVSAADSGYNVSFVVALEKDGRIIGTLNHNLTVLPEENNTLDISFSGTQSSDYRLLMFLLDGETYAPLCKSRDLNGVQPKINGSNGLITISEVVSIHSRTVNNDTGTIHLNAVNENISPAFPYGHEKSQFLDLGSFEISTILLTARGETESYTGVNYTFNIENIDQLAQKYQSGESIVPDETTHIDEMRGVGVSGKIAVTKNVKLFDRSLGDQDPESPLQFFYVKGSGNAAASLGNISARDGYTKPSASLGGTIKGGVATAHIIKKDFKIWKTNDWKINVDSSLDVTTFEVGGGATVGGDQLFELSGSAGVDALRLNNKFTLSKGGVELLSVSFNPGAGAGVSAKGRVSGDKVELKAGAKVGLGGEVGISVNPLGIVKAICGSEMVKNLKNANEHKIKVYNEKDDGERDLIASAGFVLDSEGNIRSLWLLPLYNAIDLPGSSIFNSALPNSAGGTNMPPEVVPAAPSGTIDNTTIINSLTPQQKMKLASSLIGLPVNILSGAEVILSMYAIQTMNVATLISYVTTSATIPKFDPFTGESYIDFGGGGSW